MFNRLANSVKDAVFPIAYTCELCGRETFGKWLCADCEDEVSFNLGITCPQCGRRTQKAQLCFDCKTKIPQYKIGVSALVYDGVVIRLIKGYKQGKRYLKDYFAQLLQPKISELPPFDAFVYVPMTKKRQKERGYNQSRLLAERLSQLFGIPVADVIEKVADTPDQKRLSAEERAENLKTCFKIKDRKACKGKTFLLVDDVLTTGATADAVCSKLKAAGAAEIYFAAIASVEYSPRPAAIPKGETQNEG